jgi:hypothetical protein
MQDRFGIFLNNDTIAYNEFLKSKEKRKIELDRIDSLEETIKDLKQRIVALEKIAKIKE